MSPIYMNEEGKVERSGRVNKGTTAGDYQWCAVGKGAKKKGINTDSGAVNYGACPSATSIHTCRTLDQVAQETRLMMLSSYDNLGRKYRYRLTVEAFSQTLKLDVCMDACAVQRAFSWELKPLQSDKRWISASTSTQE